MTPFARPDIDQLAEILDRLPRSQRVLHLVADAGFDSGPNHRLLREFHGIRSTIPPEHGRPPKDPDALPTDKHRRLMKTRFNKKALRGRSHNSRCRDLYLRVLTHNIALALLQVFYRALTTPF